MAGETLCGEERTSMFLKSIGESRRGETARSTGTEEKQCQEGIDPHCLIFTV